MIGSGFIDNLDNDFCGDLFDHIDDFLDFPMEDVDGVGGFKGECDAFQGACWPPVADTLAGSTTSIFPSKNEDTTTSELPTELSVPHEDIAQLEWLSNFVEDSFSAGSIIEKESPLIGGNVIKKENSSNNDKEIKETHEFQTPSPTSVLESSSSCSVSNGSSSGFRTMPLSPITFVPGRARSKRPRPAYFKPRINIPIISPSSSCGSEEELYPYSSFESALEIENYVESPPVKKIHFKPIGLPSVTEMDNHPKQQEKKKKKKKLLLPPPSPTSSGSGSATDQLPHPGTTVRKCLHCEITKTPQWRAGPLGPKTLCNACGVRYKSGRLFPEYRPAASPTFVPSLHSNSHKKVLEMRTSVAHEASSSSATTDTSELVPNNNPMLASI